MVAFIQIVLLLFIAGFLVVQAKGGSLGGLFNKRRKIVLDSCALIDGRIVELVKNGFIADDLIIPQFILNELQLLADGHDGHKRERARFGLDIAHELQDTAFGAQVIIDRTPFPEVPATDDKLIQLAKKLEAYLYTTDYNLSKVASIEAVGVLNVNELSQSLRPVALPGETLKIKIVQKGSNANQGVGYLEDGTMIVVEGAARYAGKPAVDVTVTRMHQTVAGKMVFGQIKEEPRQTPAGAAGHGRRATAAATASAAVQQAAAAPQKPKIHERLRAAATTPAPKAQKPAKQTAVPPRRRSTTAASFQKIM